MQANFRGKLAAVLFAAGALAVGPVFADKPEGVGQGKSGKGDKEWRKADGRGHEARRDERGEERGEERGDDRRSRYFDDSHRSAVRAYFDDSHRSGRCPPGLAKKHNGCLPPGQAKKWTVGHPLPRDVIFYDLPPAVIVRLGPPPSGHRFVRVAGDILLIAIGTGMVIDAIDDLARQ